MQWEIIADNLHKAGWSYGYVSALDRERRTIWIADAHRYGKRFIVRADETLTAFGELQRRDTSSRCAAEFGILALGFLGMDGGPQLCSYSFVQRFS